MIGATELENNTLLKSFFAPDVQLFDSTGAYHPVPDGATKDCLSFGIGFTGVPASF